MTTTVNVKPAATTVAARTTLAAVRARARLVVDLIASMKLTVVLLALLGVITYFGTLAQVDRGLYEVQKEYFESLFVVHDTGLSVGPVPIKLPLPGAYPLLTLLFVNLIVGGLVRLRWNVRNLGIMVTHLGMALLLVAGFVKLNFSFSGHVSLYEGKESATVVSFHDYEVALMRQVDGKVLERTLPEASLAAAVTAPLHIGSADLPFDIEISHWLDNCRAMPKGPMFEAETPVIEDGHGPGVFVKPVARDKERENNIAGCYVTVTERSGGAQHQGILYGRELRPFDDQRYPFTFVVGGVTWGLDLRRVVWDLPFSVRLDRFEKRDHPGTMTPRDFSSWVTVRENGAERPAHIYMNAPLRKDRHVFFQTSWGPQPGSSMQGPPWWSVFEVANNPSDQWPQLASYVILAGLLLHFIPKLVRHLSSGSRRGVVA